MSFLGEEIGIVKRGRSATIARPLSNAKFIQACRCAWTNCDWKPLQCWWWGQLKSRPDWDNIMFENWSNAVEGEFASKVNYIFWLQPSYIHISVQELAQLKREAEMLKQEVDMMRIHKERMQASQEGNILAHLRESLPKPERQARLNQETNQMAEQVHNRCHQLALLSEFTTESPRPSCTYPTLTEAFWSR